MYPRFSVAPRKMKLTEEAAVAALATAGECSILLTNDPDDLVRAIRCSLTTAALNRPFGIA